MFLERKRSTDKMWHLDAGHEVVIDYPDTSDEHSATVELHSGRCYELFGRLAGVRYLSHKVSPKGIPSDASGGFLTACEQYDDDAHSHSYVLISKYTRLLKAAGLGDGWDVNTSEWRNPFTEVWLIPHPFHTVLAYIHDEQESNAINYILTNDPYYLNEEFRLVFFFDD